MFDKIAARASLILLFLSCSPIVLGGGALDVEYCSKVSNSLGVSEKYLTKRLKLKALILNLLELDMNTRAEILAYELPDDLKSEEHLVKLSDIESLSYIDGAKCFLNRYQKGDVISEYEIDNDFGYEKGYVLMRGDKFLAVLVIDLKIV